MLLITCYLVSGLINTLATFSLQFLNIGGKFGRRRSRRLGTKRQLPSPRRRTLPSEVEVKMKTKKKNPQQPLFHRYLIYINQRTCYPVIPKCSSHVIKSLSASHREPAHAALFTLACPSVSPHLKLVVGIPNRFNRRLEQSLFARA